jgi:ABC-type transport system substrate-binding protein
MLDAGGFHPYLNVDAISAEYQARVYASGLLRRHPQTLEWMPNMAETWNAADDGKTFTFSLRRDMKWSDGKPITAQDFAWTFEQANRPQNNYPYRASFDALAAFVAKDEYTLVVTLKQASCVGIEVVDAVTGLRQGGKVRDAVLRAIVEAAVATGAGHDFDRPPHHR